ncbi:PREDICTED: uncharacterized protein LOC108566026 [Nicrophorus vespilloides]|uniref:Uncharacterized protein LOC108566026 n=1 Tax=Nicrophorus vespilloides TaxID=110193 RepID=A0ABM1N312_NICVS|nr:PREDICTED: uncharacterized protein LOC108566026 [Nicrophorus vespilloides]
MFSHKKRHSRLPGRISSVIDNKFVYKDGYKLKKEIADIVQKDIKFSNNLFVKLIDIKLHTKDAGSKSKNASNRHLRGVSQSKEESPDPCFSHNSKRIPKNKLDIQSVSMMTKSKNKSKPKEEVPSTQTISKKKKWKRSNVVDCSLTPITSKHHFFTGYTIPTLHPTLTRNKSRLQNIEDAHLHCRSTLKTNIHQPETTILNTESNNKLLDNSQQVQLEVGCSKVDAESKQISAVKPVQRVQRKTRQNSSDDKAIEERSISSCNAKNIIRKPEISKLDAQTKNKERKLKTTQCKVPIESKYAITGKTELLESDGNFMKKNFRTTITLKSVPISTGSSKKKRRKSTQNNEAIESETNLLTSNKSEKPESVKDEKPDAVLSSNLAEGNIVENKPEFDKSKKKRRRSTIEDTVAELSVNIETKRKRVSTSRTLDQKIADAFKDTAHEEIPTSNKSITKQRRSTRHNDTVQSKIDETKIEPARNKRRRSIKDDNIGESKLEIDKDTIKIKPVNKITSNIVDKQIATSNNYTKTEPNPETVPSRNKKTRHQSTPLEKLETELQNKRNDNDGKSVDKLTSKTKHKKITVGDYVTKPEPISAPVNKNKRKHRSSTQLEELKPDNKDKFDIRLDNKFTTGAVDKMHVKKKRRGQSSQFEDNFESELNKEEDQLDRKSIYKLASNNIEQQITRDVTKTEANTINVKKKKKRRPSTQLEDNIESVPNTKPTLITAKRERRKSSQLDKLESELKNEEADLEGNSVNKLASNNIDQRIRLVDVPKTEPILIPGKRKSRRKSTQLEDNLETELKKEEADFDGNSINKLTTRKSRRKSTQLEDSLETKLKKEEVDPDGNSINKLVLNIVDQAISSDADVPKTEPVLIPAKRKSRRKSTQLQDNLETELKKEEANLDGNSVNKLPLSNIDQRITSVVDVPKTEPIPILTKRERRRKLTQLEDNLESELEEIEAGLDEKPISKPVLKKKNKNQTSKLNDFNIKDTNIINSNTEDQKTRNYIVDTKSETFSLSARSSSCESKYGERILDSMLKCKKDEPANVNDSKKDISNDINLYKSKKFEDATDSKVKGTKEEVKMKSLYVNIPNILDHQHAIKSIHVGRKDRKINRYSGLYSDVFKFDADHNKNKAVTTLASIAKEKHVNGSLDNIRTKTSSRKLLHNYNYKIESHNEVDDKIIVPNVSVSKRKEKYREREINNDKTATKCSQPRQDVIMVDTRAPKAEVSFNNEKIENSQINCVLGLECELPAGIQSESPLGSPTDIVKSISNNNNEGNIKCTTGICEATFRMFKSASDNNILTSKKVHDKRSENLSTSELTNRNEVQQDTQIKSNTLTYISTSIPLEQSEVDGSTTRRQLGSFKIPKKTQIPKVSNDEKSLDHPQVNQSSTGECAFQNPGQKNVVSKRIPSIIKSTDVNSDLRSKLNMLRSIKANRAYDEISIYASTELESDLELDVSPEDLEIFDNLEEDTNESKVQKDFLNNSSIGQLVGAPLCTSTPIVPNPIVTNWLHGCKPSSKGEMIPILKMTCRSFNHCVKPGCTYLHSLPRIFFEIMFESTHEQLTTMTWFLFKNCNMLVARFVIPVMCQVYSANNDDSALIYLVHQLFKTGSSTTPDKFFFIQQILTALSSMLNHKYTFSKAVQTLLHSKLYYRNYSLPDILLSCILMKQDVLKHHWSLIKLVLNNNVNIISPQNINCILEETIAENYEHLYNDVYRYLLQDNPTNILKVRPQLFLDFKTHHRSFEKYQTPIPARPPSATSFSIISNVSEISYNEISVEDAKIIATTISDGTVASFIDVIKKNSVDDFHSSVVTHCISQLTKEDLFLAFHNFLLEVVEYSKVNEYCPKLFKLLNNLIFNSLLYYNIYKLYKEAGEMLVSVSIDELLQCKWYANNNYKSNMQTTDQKLVFIIKFLARGRYFEEAFQLITRPDFELDNKCKKELYNYKTIIVKEFIDLTLDDDYHDYRNIIDYFIKNYPTVCHDSGIWRSYNKYLIKHLNENRSSSILQEFEFLKKNYANVRPFVLRAVLVELWKRTGILSVFPLYEYCCKRKIYTQQIGLEGHITVWSNTLVEEVTITFQAFILKMLKGKTIPRPLKMVVQNSEETDEDDMIPKCFKNSVLDAQLKIILGLSKASPPISLKASPIILLNYEIVKRSMEIMRRMIPINAV